MLKSWEALQDFKPSTGNFQLLKRESSARANPHHAYTGCLIASELPNTQAAYVAIYSRHPVVSPNDSALGLFDELGDLRDLFCLRQFLAHRFDCLAGVVFRAVN